jgi:alkaline phosphatase
VCWVTDTHTATWVPLFAWGPESERFAGVFDNTELHDRLVEALQLE